MHDTILCPNNKWTHIADLPAPALRLQNVGNDAAMIQVTSGAMPEAESGAMVLRPGYAMPTYDDFAAALFAGVDRPAAVWARPKDGPTRVSVSHV